MPAVVLVHGNDDLSATGRGVLVEDAFRDWAGRELRADTRQHVDVELTGRILLRGQQAFVADRRASAVRSYFCEALQSEKFC